MIDEWKDIIGYEGLYQIDKYGNLLSVKRNKILSPSIHRDGYIKYSISKNGKKKTFLAHRLVAIAFIPNQENKPKVNHKDGVKSNNYVDNLEWVTVSENTQHAYDNGFAKGQNGGNNKPVVKINQSTNSIVDCYESITEASIKNNTYRRYISSVLNTDEIYLGYIWRRKEDIEL